MRLDKFLCDCQIGSRSQVKQIIKQGQVIVNDKKAIAADLQINEEKDVILYKGNRLQIQKGIYYILNKPAGVVTATTDNVHKTVLDLMDIPEKKLIFPVGRLDIDTEGLLLLTDDGELAHRLLSPKKHVDKTYLVNTIAPVTDADLDKLEAGVDIGEDKLTLPAKANRVGDKEILLTIREGKFHQVKRMLMAIGNSVVSLKRVSFGPLSLDDSLNTGEYRKLTDEEIKALYE